MSIHRKRVLPVLLAAVAALAAGALAVSLGFGSSHREAPGISLDPSADNTDVYAWTAKDAPGALTVRRELDPAGGTRPAARTSSGSTTRRATTSTSTTPATARRRHATGSSSRRRSRNKNSFLYAAPGVTSIDDPKLNVVQRYDRDARVTTRNGSRRPRSRTIARDLPVAPTNIGPKTFPNYDAVAGGDPARCPAAARCSSASATIRSSSTSARRSTGSTSRKRHRQPGRRQGRPGGLQHPLGRAADPRGPGDAGRQVRRPARRRPTPSSACGRPPSAGACRCCASAGRTRAVEQLGPGLPPRQPAGQRGRDPARQEGPVQPDDARPRRDAVRQVRGQARAGAAPQRAVQPRRQGDRPHGHRAGAAHRTPRPDRRSAPSGPPARHAEAQPRRAAGARPPNRFGVHRRRHSPASRTAAASATTSWTSSSGSSPGCLEAASRSRSATAWTGTTSRSCPTFPYVAAPAQRASTRTLKRIEPAHPRRPRRSRS